MIAEIIFETREGADNVVDTFNNQNVSFYTPSRIQSRRSSELIYMI